MKALEIHHLSKLYNNNVLAIDGISLDVAQGDFFGLLGPNAAGKSTLIGIVTSLITKTSGEVQVFGNNLDTRKQAAKEYIGLVPQEFNFNKTQKIISILENQAGYYGIPRYIASERSEYYLKKLGLWERRNDEARFISGGQKRRLMLARALVHEPRLLILDEPTAGVDLESRRSIWAFLDELNSHGTTIILTTHYLEEAETLCKTIAIIDQGKLVTLSEKTSLLKKLEIETVILSLDKPLLRTPLNSRFESRLLEQTTLEVQLDKEQSISELFYELSHHNLNILSMRNKNNRLEELFLNLTSRGNNKDNSDEYQT